MNKEILFLNPVFTHNIWGGTKLREEYGYEEMSYAGTGSGYPQ